MSDLSIDGWSRRLVPYVIAILVSVAIGLTLHATSIYGPAEAFGFSLFVFVILLVCAAMRGLRRTLQNERGRRNEAERALRQTSALEALARALSKAQTLAEVTQACLSELLPAVGAAAGAVALVSDDGRQLGVVRAMGYTNPEAATRYTVTLASKTVLTEVARRQTPLTFVSQEDRDIGLPDLSFDPLLDDGEGAIVMPLIVSGRAIGVVALSYQHPHSFDSDEPSFLMGAGQRTAQALDRAMRYERAERARADLEAFRTQAEIEIRERQRAEDALRESEARYRALAARTTRLYTLSAGLSEAVTLDAVAKVIVREGKVVAGASAGSVTVLDGAQFETLYADEYPRQLAEAWHRFPAESGLCATAAVETRRPVFIGSFVEWQQQYPRSASMAADGGYASAAVLPLLVEGSPIGVLSFHFTAPVNFDDQYQALLTSVAHHAAQAIDRARLYEAAQRARADAEAANRSKDDFLSIVSHELRTPLSAVLGWAAMLRSHTLDAARAPRAIEAIYSNATRQAHLIDELLDVSRIVAGRVPLDLQEVDLAENIRGAVETILPLAEAKGLQVRVAPLPHTQVVADPHRLEQVFVNLLGNAVKFTPAGGTVTVDVARSARSVDVRVEDTGRGIDATFLPHVFERFRQADSTVARSVGGLGLGLFIARRLVDAHGGRIGVESEGEDLGATFTVSLPTANGSHVTERPTPEITHVSRDEPAGALPSLHGVRILLVDDEHDAREVMASALQTCGATVLSASSVDDALEMLTRSQGRIDVLLSDIAMPGKDGYDLIRQVRAQSIGNVASIPAAAVTACAGADERQRALAAGFQMHLVKPLGPEALAHAVASLANVERASIAAVSNRRA
jgi:signal transduction histidine kinase/ActR/RegA family two-component response regulator/two-component sensor histidine kinase